MIILFSCYFNIFLKHFIPKIESFMAVIGAVYMLYLAVKIMTSKQDDGDTAGDKHNSFIAGLLLQFINPKGILYGVTVTSTLIFTYHASYLSLLIYSIVLAFIGYPGTFCWSIFGSILKNMTSKYRRQFNILMGLLLLYSAASFVIG